MKNKMQRRGVTSKKKALSGIPQKLRDSSNERNRKNMLSKNGRLGTNSSKQISYANMEKSAMARRERPWRRNALMQYDEGVSKPRGMDRFNAYSANRNQLTPHQLRYGTEDYFYEFMRPNINHPYLDLDARHYQEQRNYLKHRRGFQAPRKMHRIPFLKNDYNSPYGEHPASRGPIEYRGSNKRHPGLGNAINTGYMEESKGAYPERRRRHGTSHKNNARLAYKDYMNRGQFERAFHAREMYDPVELEYELREQESRGPDHLYRYKGYQGSGNVEGFGIRSERHHGQDWIEEDEYRHGHARRRRGYGKYGSR